MPVSPFSVLQCAPANSGQMVITVEILSRHETLKSLLLYFTTNAALKSLEDVPA
jgi:hypothetical protein